MAAVFALHESGIEVVMRIGNNEVTGRRIADELGIDTVIAEVCREDRTAELQKAGRRGDGR